MLGLRLLDLTIIMMSHTKKLTHISIEYLFQEAIMEEIFSKISLQPNLRELALTKLEKNYMNIRDIREQQITFLKTNL